MIAIRGVKKILKGATMMTTSVLGLVRVLGFTQNGIVAGTLAARLMSWSAIMCGGGVPRRGVVAFLQWLGTVSFGPNVCAAVDAWRAVCAAYIIYAQITAKGKLATR